MVWARRTLMMSQDHMAAASRDLRGFTSKIEAEKKQVTFSNPRPRLVLSSPQAPALSLILLVYQISLQQKQICSHKSVNI